MVGARDPRRAAAPLGPWFGMGGQRPRLRQAVRTAAPVRDLRLVDLVAHVVDRRQTRRRAHGAVDVDETAADAADQMMVIVSNPTLEASRGSGRLYAPNQPFGDQNSERVVHRLERNRPDFGPDQFGHSVGRDVGLARDRAEDGQSLGCDLDAVVSKEIGGVSGHT